MEFISNQRVKDGIWDTFVKDIIDMDVYGSDEQKESRKSNEILQNAQEDVLKAQISLLRKTLELDCHKYKNQDPLQFWKKDKSFLLLHDAARFHLCSMASSAPSERTFKSSSFIFSENRPLLDEQNVEYATFIRENYSMDELIDELLELGIDFNGMCLELDEESGPILSEDVMNIEDVDEIESSTDQ
jgi:hypothetical protein